MRNFLGFAIVAVLIIFGFVLIVRTVTRSPAKPTTTQVSKQDKFSEKTVQVRLTTEGAIVSREKHRTIRITINPSSRKVEVLKGYDGEVERTLDLGNDQEAFTRFLIALDSYGYTGQNAQVSKDERGVCPQGNRYIYEATYKTGAPLRTWSSSCGAGQLLGKGGASIRQLFQSQIPDYSKFVSGISL